MFEKLLAALPYNPSLLHQLSFYGKRMRREESVRRTGVTFLLLAFLIQFFAVISPPQATVADSTNDLINNGITSAADAANHCQANTGFYKDILANYGISCDAVAKASTVSIKSTDFANRLYSMGRLAYGKTGEQPVSINGKTYYVRPLSSWDTGPFSTYKALKLSVGTTSYYILYNCGNLVSIGVPAAIPQTPAPAPNFTVVKGVRLHKDGASLDGPYYKDVTVKPGDKVDFSIELNNTGNVALKTVQFRDTIPNGMSTVPGSLAVDGKPLVALLAGFNAGPLAAGQFKRVTFSSTVPTNANACGANHYTNSVTIAADTLPAKESSATVQACQPAQIPTQTPNNTPIPTPTPTVTPCQYNTSLPASSPECKPCDKSVSSSDAFACISVRKTAANLTQSLADANNTQAKAGDVIVYTLYAQNSGKATVKDFVFQENISDVLDYADITDFHGSTQDANKVLTWPAVDIKANETAMQRVTVKVKSPIPQTPVSTSDAGHFDLTMTNVYGNTINITLPGGTIKKVETVAAALPNTGPGTSLMVAAFTVMIAGYFYARSRLLANEVTLTIQDNNSGGF